MLKIGFLKGLTHDFRTKIQVLSLSNFEENTAGNNND